MALRERCGVSSADDHLSRQLNRAAERAAEANQLLRAYITAAKDRFDQLFEELLADVDAMTEHFGAKVTVAEDTQRRAERQYQEAISCAYDKLALADITLDVFDNPLGYFVYLLFGDDPVKPVYIGQSRNVLARLATHMSDSEKRDKTRRVQLVRCPDEATMDATERALIARYQPLLNTVGCKAVTA